MRFKKKTCERQILLSDASVWNHISDYYKTEGVQAWFKGRVPYYYTSNARIADQYAQLIQTFIFELQRQGRIQSKDPIRIIELGAGLGQFSFRCINQLMMQFPSLNIEYIMTDIANKNITYWEQHPQLGVLIKQKRLKVRQLDICNPQSVTQVVGNMPIIFIANYLFDGLPNDMVYYNPSGASNVLFNFETKHDPAGPSKNKPSHHYEHIAYIQHGSPYVAEDVVLKEVLKQEAERYPANLVLLPKAAIDFIRTLQHCVRSPTLLLAYDLGFNEQDFSKLRKKNMRLFSSQGTHYSYVNFHFIGEYVKASQGDALVSSHVRGISNQLAVYLLKQSFAEFPQTKALIERMQAHCANNVLSTCLTIYRKQVPYNTLAQLAHLIRLSAYESTFLDALLQKLSKCPQLKKHERLDWLDIVYKMQATYFELPGQDSIPPEYFLFGQVYYILKDYQRAQQCFLRYQSLGMDSELLKYFLTQCAVKIETPNAKLQKLPIMLRLSCHLKRLTCWR